MLKLGTITISNARLGMQGLARMSIGASQVWASAPVFNVVGLSPALWLDAADSSTLYDATTGGNLVVADGAVARWEDKSGNARHATKATVGAQPMRKTNTLNGRGTVLFDGVDDGLTVPDFTIPESHTIFIVCRPKASGKTWNTLLSNNNGTIGLFARADLLKFTNYPSSSTLSSYTLETCYVLTHINGTWRINGREDITAAVRTWVAQTIGNDAGSEAFHGDIAEMIVVNSALAVEDVTATEEYLAAKWGIGLRDILDYQPLAWYSDTGSDPSTWTDLSTHGWHLTNATPEGQPAVIVASPRIQLHGTFYGICRFQCNDTNIHSVHTAYR